MSALALILQRSPLTNELKAALNEALRTERSKGRGISVESVAINPVTLTPEDMQKINRMEDAEQRSPGAHRSAVAINAVGNPRTPLILLSSVLSAEIYLTKGILNN